MSISLEKKNSFEEKKNYNPARQKHHDFVLCLVYTITYAHNSFCLQ